MTRRFNIKAIRLFKTRFQTHRVPVEFTTAAGDYKMAGQIGDQIMTRKYGKDWENDSIRTRLI